MLKEYPLAAFTLFFINITFLETWKNNACIPIFLIFLQLNEGKTLNNKKNIWTFSQRVLPHHFNFFLAHNLHVQSRKIKLLFFTLRLQYNSTELYLLLFNTIIKYFVCIVAIFFCIVFFFIWFCKKKKKIIKKLREKKDLIKKNCCGYNMNKILFFIVTPHLYFFF